MMTILSILILILLISIYFIRKYYKTDSFTSTENNEQQIVKQILSNHPRKLSGLIISIIIIGVSCFIFLKLDDIGKYFEYNLKPNNSFDTHPFEQDQRKLIRNRPGNASCSYEVKNRIESINGYHTGIEHKGGGVFMAFVATPTTNYEYKVVYFYTNSNCEIIDVKTL